MQSVIWKKKFGLSFSAPPDEKCQKKSFFPYYIIVVLNTISIYLCDKKYISQIFNILELLSDCAFYSWDNVLMF